MQSELSSDFLFVPVKPVVCNFLFSFSFLPMLARPCGHDILRTILDRGRREKVRSLPTINTESHFGIWYTNLGQARLFFSATFCLV